MIFRMILSSLQDSESRTAHASYIMFESRGGRREAAAQRQGPVGDDR
jgi:hypothetical protein